MARLTGIHWLAPTIMLASFTCGVLLAVGHHIFYASLRGKPIPTEPYRPFRGASFPQQQFNTSVGTAFAFFIRIFLSIAAGTAYTQIFWSSIKGVKKQSPTLAELDWASAGLQNVFGVFNLKHGRGYPMLVVMAIIFWCVPIATIFTPGTLSVESASVRSPWNDSMARVPQYDFATMNLAAPLTNTAAEAGVDDWEYQGPSQPLQHVALAVMGGGSILPIDPPCRSNMSWSQDVWGPALTCIEIEGSERDDMWVNIWNSYNSTTESSITYMSWVPWSWKDQPFGLGLRNISLDPYRNQPYIFNDVSFGDYEPEITQRGPPPGDVAGDGPASLWIAVLPNMQSLGFSHLSSESPKDIYWSDDPSCAYTMITDLTAPYPGECAGVNGTFFPVKAFDESTLLRCDLLNTSYSIDFNYTNGVQDVRVKTDTTINTPVLNGSAYFLGPKLGIDGAVNPDGACATFHTNPIPNGEGTPCVFDLDAIRMLSYQSISAAFNQFITGSVSINTLYDGIATNTTIMKTVLAQTNELAYLRQVHTRDFLAQPPLQSLITNDSDEWWDHPGLASSQLPSVNRDLKTALVELFENLTISVISEPYFLPNYSSSFAPDQSPSVTVGMYRNVYAYDPVTLWIAYGLSILFTALAVLAGTIALVQNGASYSNYFSTILRVSRTAELDIQVAGRDGPGHDPLPAYLQDARLDLGSQAVDARGYELVKGSTDQQSLVRSHEIELPRVARTYDGH
ncbi:hypothetical protein LTR97_004555 [Elasticomyces elasticus]|uniref:Uncharacterized protein n=1 Tax=Elasticomyces elasticus TaxID=574655 RepID=A0AAN7WC29_9PEZI|nr:hypothetical protein LTR97_004555 [Elasticomyces elasticus]